MAAFQFDNGERLIVPGQGASVQGMVVKRRDGMRDEKIYRVIFITVKGDLDGAEFSEHELVDAQPKPTIDHDIGGSETTKYPLTAPVDVYTGSPQPAFGPTFTFTVPPEAVARAVRRKQAAVARTVRRKQAASKRLAKIKRKR